MVKLINQNRSSRKARKKNQRTRKNIETSFMVPEGVQHNFKISRLGSGWMVHYEKPYSDITKLTDVQPKSGRCMLWGAKRKPGDEELAIAAIGLRENILQNERVWENGVFWYMEDHQANGSACDSNIQLNHADNLNSCC